MTPEQQAASRAACLENWPEAESMAYNPNCCRFPKSCSIEDPPERGGEIKPFEYTTDSIPAQLSEGGPVAQLEVELNVNTVLASVAEDESEQFVCPALLMLDHQPRLDTDDTVTFAETEPWDQYTEKMQLTFSRLAWESQGAPEVIYVSMLTVRPTTKENE